MLTRRSVSPLPVLAHRAGPDGHARNRPQASGNHDFRVAERRCAQRHSHKGGRTGIDSAKRSRPQIGSLLELSLAKTPSGQEIGSLNG